MRTDAQLLQAHRDGDPNAFAALTARYRKHAVALAHSIVGDWHWAEDVAQDALLNVLRRADSYDARQSFQNWFMTIVANRAKDLLRYLKRRQSPSYDAVRATTSDDPMRDALVEMAWDGNAPDANLETVEADATLVKAVGQLKWMFRAAIEMSYFQGLTYQQMAIRMNCPMGTVKSRINTGIRYLRQDETVQALRR